ncbi:MAG TPA: RNA polymerase sigma factor [Candidatus Hydrogenedentes bacterium]|nr:RNA polymerase sigma factor [Candidatus Hydrogenedentota bacterium]HRK33006.1 RNA polymerase sigma factor [Candidatus Hydrogenedentota bacterium]
MVNEIAQEHVGAPQIAALRTRKSDASVVPTSVGVETNSATDLELVERTRVGEIEAFSHLVRRHEQLVYNLAYRFMRDQTLAEDMAQESFIKAFRLLKGFRGDCSFATWLYRVTCSVCLTELDKRKRRREVELTNSYEDQLATAPVPSSDTPELIRRCVSKLPDRYATIVSMYYLQDISYDEIARTMDVPMGTLKTWMHRARLRLRTLVESELSAHPSGDAFA